MAWTTRHSLTMRYSILIVLLSLVGTSLAAGIPYVTDSEEVPFIAYWPWMGSLHQRFGGFVCGCSLISRNWAVTAASCVQSPPYNVRFGSLKQSDGGTVRPVTEIVEHESYRVSGSYKYYDVAVLGFSPLELGNDINTIELGATTETSNSNCYITGWGKLHYSDVTYPEHLHQGKTRIETNSVCDDRWSSIYSYHICTYRSSSYPHTCNGDEGGPLACYRGGQYELVGISSWQQSSCSSSGWEPVFTRVSYFRVWILEKTRAAPK